MAHLDQSFVGLRIFGDDLSPDEITSLLGCDPTDSYRNGDIVIASPSGREYLKKTGMWRLAACERSPENLDAQVKEILDRLTSDMKIWSLLSSRFTIDVLCGFFMASSNEGCDISANTLLELGKRGIELSLDIYSPTQETNVG